MAARKQNPHEVRHQAAIQLQEVLRQVTTAIQEVRPALRPKRQVIQAGVHREVAVLQAERDKGDEGTKDQIIFPFVPSPFRASTLLPHSRVFSPQQTP